MKKKREIKTVKSIRVKPSFMIYLKKKKMTLSQWFNKMADKEMGVK